MESGFGFWNLLTYLVRYLNYSLNSISKIENQFVQLMWASTCSDEYKDESFVFGCNLFFIYAKYGTSNYHWNGPSVKALVVGTHNS